MYNNSIFILQKRLLAVLLLVTFVFIAIVFRLGYLQLVQNEWLQSLAAKQWFRSLPLTASRGSIYDCNGNALAISYSTYDVYVRASRVSNAKQVSMLLSEKLKLDYDDVFKKVSNKNVSESLIQKGIESDVASSINKSNLSGIVMSQSSKRYYPYGDLLTQVLGFTTIDNIGQTGLEAYYDKYLKGVNGYALEQSDVHGVKIDNTLSRYIPSISGLDVSLTIDANMQMFLENALSKLMQEQNPDNATGIIMNPNTGEIVAMSTKPSFDLNNVPRNDIDFLLNSMRNISVTDVYEPGSTFKVLTMAASIESGVTNLNERFFDPGYRIVDGDKIKCWKLTGHGSQTLSEGLCNSCNSVFVDLALRLGVDKMYEWFDTYGLGDLLGVDFAGEGGGIIMNKDSVKNVDLARMGFGQCVAVTPIQLLSAFNSVINGGTLYQPYFVDKISSNNDNVVFDGQKSVIGQTISKKTSDIMKVMVEDVVKQYSGINSFIPGYRISGKTGTTQKYVDGQIKDSYIASFVGAIPADNPEYTILIIVDEPRGASYFGSVAATPYAKLVFEDIIDYKNYQPHNLEQDLKKIEPTICMPDLIGENYIDAIKLLEGSGVQIKIQGQGDKIIEQTPSASTMIYPNAITLITLG